MKTRKKFVKNVTFLMACILFFMSGSRIVHAETVENYVPENIGEEGNYVQGIINEEGMVLATISIPSDNARANSENGEICDNGVRLRTAPSTSATILELMYNGEHVLIDFKTSFSQSNGTWYYIKRIKTGTWGWVSRDYVICWD